MAAAQKFNDQSYVYTVSNFKFTVAGQTYAVLRVVMSIQDSGIPAVIVTINPKPNPKPADIDAPGIGDFAKWQNTLQALVNTAAGVASLSFTVSCDADRQTVNIKDWPLTQVGAENIAANGNFNTYVVLQHPIFNATTAILTMLNTYADMADGTILVGEDIVELVLASMDKYLDQKNPANSLGEATPPDEVDVTQLNRMDGLMYEKARKAVDVLEKYVKWDTGYRSAVIPLESIDPEITEYLEEGGLDLDTYLLDRESPYHTMMTVFGEMMLMTWTDFSNSSIYVKPFEPWGASEYRILTTDVSQIDLPAYAVNPISAVAVMGMGNIGAASTLVQNTNVVGANGSPGLNTDAQVVVGGYFDVFEVLKGHVLVTYPPAWLANYANSRPSGSCFNSPAGMNSSAAESGGGVNAQAGTGRAALNDTWTKICNAYAADEFWRRFRADTMIALGLRLMITNSDGKQLRPGLVTDLVAPDGTVVYTCYITGVQHTIDVMGARAFTSISGAYVRSSGGVTGVYSPEEPVKSQIYNGPAAGTEEKAGTGGGTAADGGGSNNPAQAEQAPVVEAPLTAEEAHCKFNDLSAEDLKGK